MEVHLFRPDITDKEVALINEVIRSAILALGPKVAEFERAIAELAPAREKCTSTDMKTGPTRA